MSGAPDLGEIVRADKAASAMAGALQRLQREYEESSPRTLNLEDGCVFNYECDVDAVPKEFEVRGRLGWLKLYRFKDDGIQPFLYVPQRIEDVMRSSFAYHADNPLIVPILTDARDARVANIHDFQIYQAVLTAARILKGEKK